MSRWRRDDGKRRVARPAPARTNRVGRRNLTLNLIGTTVALVLLAALLPPVAVAGAALAPVDAPLDADFLTSALLAAGEALESGDADLFNGRARAAQEREEKQCAGPAQEAGADGPICQQELASSRRLTWLPNMTFLSSPIPMRSSICSFKATCCDMAGFNSAQGQMEAFDLWADGAVATAVLFQQSPGDLLSWLLHLLSDNVFAVDRDRSLLQSDVKEPLGRLVSAISNQNVLVRFSTLVNLAVGYETALLCSTCDPAQTLYVRPVEPSSASLSSSSSSSSLSLALDEGICLDMSQALVSFTELLQAALVSSRNLNALNSTFNSLCPFATDPFEASKKKATISDGGFQKGFPRKGRPGCEQMRADVQSVGHMLAQLNVSAVSLLGCDGVPECAEFLCERVLQGLAFSLAPVRSSLREALEVHCVPPQCNPFALQDYVDYFLADDEARFTQGGADVINRVESLRSESRLDARRLGCGGFLSRHACVAFADVTFASAHIKGLVITGVLGGIVALAALFALYRKARAKWTAQGALLL